MRFAVGVIFRFSSSSRRPGFRRCLSTRCALSVWSCCRPPQEPLGSELLVFNWDHHINSGVDVGRGHFDRPHVGDVANRRSSIEAKKTVCCVCYCCAFPYVRGAVRNQGRREDGKTNEVNDLHSFRGHAADVGSSWSRATVQQTPGNWLSTHEIQRWGSYAPSNISDAVCVARAGWPHLKHLLWHTAEAHRQCRLRRWQCWVADWRLHRLTWMISVFGFRHFGNGRVPFHM